MSPYSVDQAYAEQQPTPEEEAEARAEREAIMADKDLAREEMNALKGEEVQQQMVDDPIDIFAGVPESQVTPENPAASMRDVGMSEEEISREVDQRFPRTRQAAPGNPAEAGQDGPVSTPAADAAGASAPRDQAAGQEGADQGLNLEAQTPADLKAKAEREAAATQAEKAKKAAEQERLRREAKDNRARADAAPDGFVLGQLADPQMSGMDDLFAQPPAAAPAPAEAAAIAPKPEPAAWRDKTPSEAELVERRIDESLKPSLNRDFKQDRYDHAETPP